MILLLTVTPLSLIFCLIISSTVLPKKALVSNLCCANLPIVFLIIVLARFLFNLFPLADNYSVAQYKSNSSSLNLCLLISSLARSFPISSIFLIGLVKASSNASSSFLFDFLYYKAFADFLILVQLFSLNSPFLVSLFLF